MKYKLPVLFLLSFFSSSVLSAVIGGDTWLLKLNSFSGSYSSTPPPYCGLSVGSIFKGSACNGIEWEYSGSTYTVTTTQFDTGNGELRGIDRNRGRSFIIGYASRAWSCPSGTSMVGGKCEPPCKQMKGQSLGTVTFSDGTRDVASLCRNSCRAKSDLFFPAATPPYGVFTYTGESCDGSESSGGETGGGETGGGETGGGETGGGETGGGETGGGETGGGETGGGET
ncbi:hypothetical protein, partial [Vibrio toranzoniae]|uniref:hypothetical protein n=1 Tax=Vibrio toranzoniae TaxID=1194427 RepID=UPI001929ADF4